MHKMKKIIAPAAILLVALVFTAGIPAFALDGESGDSTTTTSTERKAQASQRRAAAEQKLAARQASRTPEQLNKACESHKQGLTRKFSNIVSNSEKIQAKIDGIYAKALAYQAEKNLQPANFDSLKTAADDAQAASLASITALKEVKPTIDCNNTSTASDVAKFKEAAKTTRDNLKDYRKAVKAVLKALKELKKPAAEGSTD